MYLIKCSKEFSDLALAEIKAYNPSVKRISEGLYECETITHLNYFAQVTHAYEFIYRGQISKTTIKLEDESFSVRTVNCTEKEKSQAQAFIYYAQQKPLVRLDNPKVEYFCQKITEEDFVYGKLIYTNNTNYNINNQKDVTHFKPITISKKLARTMVNLSGVTKGVIHDPFCGFGGLLYEALQTEQTVIGGDIEEEMLIGAKEYLYSFNQEKIHIIKESALTTMQKSDAIVSDLPFGKATKNISTTLYKDFLLHVKKTKITNKLVLGFPDFHNPIQIIKDCGLEPSDVFTLYIHKSLSRIIVVIEL